MQPGILLAIRMTGERSKRAVKPPKKFEEIQGGSQQATIACLHGVCLDVGEGVVPRTLVSTVSGMQPGRCIVKMLGVNVEAQLSFKGLPTADKALQDVHLTTLEAASGNC